MSGTFPASIVVVGGGASGIILAAHLMRHDPPPRVTVIERRPVLGQGIAYSTPLPEHVLNVGAFGMSALADEPRHFVDWLEARSLADPHGAPFYAPRYLYGRYLNDLSQELRGRGLTVLSGEIVGLSETLAGVEARLADGLSAVGQICVLATGHSEQPAAELAPAMRIGSAADGFLDPDARVLILGTGLSMVDALLTLDHRGHRGEVIALSRRGLLPMPHRVGHPFRLDVADIPLGTSLHYFVHWFRDFVRSTEAEGGNWRDAVDGLRPYNQLIWQNWTASSKRRFLELTKAWWDIHRHRMAPEIHARVTAALATGRLRLVAGRVDRIGRDDGHYDAEILHRASHAQERLSVARVYGCTGIAKNVAESSNPVVRALIAGGLGRPDPLGIGLDVTPGCHVIGRGGEVSQRLFAVGPLTRGTFFEIEAIPDIRAQCKGLASALLPSD